MAESLNQQIADALVEQQLKDARVELQLRREACAVLALLEADVLAMLKGTDPTQFVLLARRRREVERLMAEALDPLIQARYRQLAAMMDEAMMRLATNEAEAVQQIVNAETEDEDTIAALPSERRLRAGVVHGLFPSPAKPTDLSTTGRDWWQRQADGLSQRIGDSLMVGVSLEEPLTDLVRRVRGTSEQGFQDGVMAKAREDAARLVRTQTTNALGEARAAVAEQNAPQMMLVHSSILDSHTCLRGETVVRTPTGAKAIQDIREGAIVFGGSGKPRLVLATHRTETRQLARVTFSDGTIVFCTPDHQFLTKDFGWAEAQKLQENTILRAETML